MRFKNHLEAEQHLEKLHVGKLLEVTQYNPLAIGTYYGICSSLAVDIATRKPPIIILIFNDGNRIEIEKDDFYDLVKILV
jgi:hypothetical protein